MPHLSRVVRAFPKKVTLEQRPEEVEGKMKLRELKCLRQREELLQRPRERETCPVGLRHRRGSVWLEWQEWKWAVEEMRSGETGPDSAGPSPPLYRCWLAFTLREMGRVCGVLDRGVTDSSLHIKRIPLAVVLRNVKGEQW